MCNKKEEKKQIGTEKNYVVCMQLRSNLIEDIEMRKKIKIYCKQDRNVSGGCTRKAMEMFMEMFSRTKAP